MNKKEKIATNERGPVSRIIGRVAAGLVPALVILCLFCGLTGAQACTAVYVGRDVSADGTVIIAKSNDYQDVWGNHVTVTERVENVPGRMMPVDNEGTVLAPLPDTTYRYTSTPFMDSANVMNGLGRDATVCANEYGVSMIMSITAFSNDAALKADPLIEHGLTEFTAVDLVVCQSATAREGVDTLLSLIDTYGSSEVNIAFIADQREVWYIEMYTGHQYAAVLLPADKVSVFGNEFLMDYVSGYDEYILSPRLQALADENGFAVYGDNGELDILATYSGPETVTGYSHMRTWIGHKILSPSTIGDYDQEALYPLCFVPDEKVSLTDVMGLIRNRYEGTEYSPDETGRTDMRVIGTDTALSVHILQIDPELPAGYAVVTWECTGPAVCGVFVPVSNGSLSVSEAYACNQSAEETYVFDTANYPYYRAKELTTLCLETHSYRTCTQPVMDYWRRAEAGMSDTMREVLKTASAMEDEERALEYVTAYCVAAQEQAFSDAGRLLESVRWYLNRNCNTMKNGRNPETHEVLDTLRELDPMAVTLDPSAYRKLPEM